MAKIAFLIFGGVLGAVWGYFNHDIANGALAGGVAAILPLAATQIWSSRA